MRSGTLSGAGWRLSSLRPRALSWWRLRRKSSRRRLRPRQIPRPRRRMPSARNRTLPERKLGSELNDAGRIMARGSISSPCARGRSRRRRRSGNGSGRLVRLIVGGAFLDGLRESRCAGKRDHGADRAGACGVLFESASVMPAKAGIQTFQRRVVRPRIRPTPGSSKRSARWLQPPGR
jgi:hypothetical protein